MKTYLIVAILAFLVFGLLMIQTSQATSIDSENAVKSETLCESCCGGRCTSGCCNDGVCSTSTASSKSSCGC